MPPDSSEEATSATATNTCPRCTGFNKFYGVLYRLQRRREPDCPTSRRTPLPRPFSPRGVLDSKASAMNNPTVDPRFGKIGKQVSNDTGPLTKKR